MHEPAMHPSLDDLVAYAARATPPSPPLVGDPDLDLAELVESLGARYGRLRTVILDGGPDPAADDRTGAPLLPVVDGLEVDVLHVWSCGRSWIGAGRTVQGRPFVAVAERVAPAEPYDPTSPEASYVERVVELTGRTMDPTYPVDWSEAEARLGTRLPQDYKQLVEILGPGQFDYFVSLDLPRQDGPWPTGHFLSVHDSKGSDARVEWHTTLTEVRAACADTPGKALLSWAGSEHGTFYWHMNDPDPDHWPVLATEDDFREFEPMAASASACLHRLLTDPRALFSLARHFDRHWFG
ncbi:SMI1/KNR4 family protein [Streptomyces indicus]|uniref:SMI1/KNR4 family protein n=1 Tax=Streptomyces indicus TaxID=417292 RepID=A0A1G9AM12_9ACTN|nr:SMI1/KNR4 family protein [Streptomyces indicus]SDK27620.1 hypothetical protein SAMN05421806_1066 [Streptomyces indicus]